ncbi:AraC family transcriptional regulator [Yinghuangia sp. ASG 101]|uniref:AraC family transcriptional regulator n=1 Tax=Yinghuangia sp. ASG 101 TaxID=2896848 RepID=UPI001E2951B7|nr:AraC family transcriptional regulator [Yinghuangia sp. ASG 101]UGQ09027.1 AraC family transcriptional regulator [Yinghuangia sp. ASG 101]
MFQDSLAASLAPYRIQPVEPGPFRGRLAVTRSSDVVVARLSCDVTVQADVESLPANAYIVTLGHDGPPAVVDGRPVERSSFVVGPRQRLRVRWTAGRPVTMVKLSRRLLERVWREQCGRPRSQPLAFTVPLNLVAVRSGLWETLADAFVTTRESGLLDSSAVNTAFGQLLAQALLTAQPRQQAPQPARQAVGPGAPGDPGDRAPHRAGTTEADDVLPVPAPVLRALEFCRAHAGDPLGVADIAEAAGISVRRLQAMFRTHVGPTPIEYVKQVRLAGVHTDLKSISRGVSYDTVTDVALRWGFTHLGRFSSTYRAQFGQLPSQTARRDRAATG